MSIFQKYSQEDFNRMSSVLDEDNELPHKASFQMIDYMRHRPSVDVLTQVYESQRIAQQVSAEAQHASSVNQSVVDSYVQDSRISYADEDN